MARFFLVLSSCCFTVAALQAATQMKVEPEVVEKNGAVFWLLAAELVDWHQHSAVTAFKQEWAFILNVIVLLLHHHHHSVLMVMMQYQRCPGMGVFN